MNSVLDIRADHATKGFNISTELVGRTTLILFLIMNTRCSPKWLLSIAFCHNLSMNEADLVLVLCLTYISVVWISPRDISTENSTQLTNMYVNTVCLRFSHEFRQFSQSQSVFFFSWISGKKCVQDKIFGIFYVQIHENLQICTDFSEISLSKNQKKVIFARNR